MKKQTRLLGLDFLHEAKWGTHLCQFYETREDLIDIFVPYFKTGLENNEFCMWVTAEPLGVEDAKASLGAAVKNLDDYIDNGQIEILDYSQWYTKSGKFNAGEVLQGWIEKLNQALQRGFDGLRLTGNTFWLDKNDWYDFAAYEATVDNVIGNHRMLAICSYSLDKCGSHEIIDVVKNHEFAIIRSKGAWELFQSAGRKRAEDKLQEKQKELDVVINSVPAQIWSKNSEGKYLWVNRSYCETLGLSEKKILGRTDYDLYPTDIANQYTKYDQEIIDFGKPISGIVEHHLKPSGDYGWSLTEKLPLYDEGNIVGTIGFALDITELKRTQKKVEETTKKLQAIFDSIDDGLAIMDKSLTVQEVNKYRLEVTGLSRDQVIGKKCYEVFQHRDKHCDMCCVQRVFEKGEAVRMEKSEILKDGIVKYFDSLYTPIFDDNGNVVQVAGSARDITDNKRAEEALRESEEKYKTLVESSLTGIFIHQDGKYVFVNDRFAEIHGYTPEELLGKEYLTLIHPDERKRLVQIASKRLNGEAVSSRYEAKRLRKNGKPFWCEMMATYTEYEGRPAVMGNIIDITDRKRAEEAMKDHSERLETMVAERTKELRDAQAQLVRREKLAALGQIAGGVAHELRNPLGAIKNTVYFLNMALKEPAPGVKDALEILNKEIATSESTITSLLEFSRPQPLTQIKVDINEVVQEALSRCLVPYNVEVESQVDDTLPQILGDPNQLGQACGNFILNAIQAMSEGGRLVIKSEAPSPEWVTVSFTDTGVGIPKVILGKVFEPLFTTKAKGIGLGLALTKMFIDSHGGTIEVESEVGKGTTFKVSLPVAEEK